jgi:hypothetical protein
VVTMPTRNYFPITRTQQCPNSSKSTYFRPWVMILSSTYLRSTLRTPSKLKKVRTSILGKLQKRHQIFVPNSLAPSIVDANLAWIMFKYELNRFCPTMPMLLICQNTWYITFIRSNVK